MTATYTKTTNEASRISQFNAWFFDRLDPFINRKFANEKRGLLVDVPSHVVEIGAGTGANLRYLPKGTQVTAIEPSVAMHDRLRRRADRLDISVSIEACGAESLPLEDHSVGMVLASLVLCTIEDVELALSEIRRVLRPGGRFVFVEHVIAPRRGLLRFAQRVLRRPWRYLFEGCDTCRDTAALVETAGFSSVELHRRRKFDPIFYPIVEQISGTATC